MAGAIKPGSVLRSELADTRYEVERLLGEGGQGQVWQVFAQHAPQLVFALKWYFPHSATPAQHRALSDLADDGPPDARFLWPLELVAGAEGGFGYIMELRDDRFKGMADLMNATVDPSFTTLATAGFHLADGFLQLHSRGLCYLDISFGNVFFDPVNGDVLICDNDNVRVDGMPAAIAGTPRFMAPEIVVDFVEGRVPRPDRSTDLYSLSVLLFHMFVMHHPLEGARELAVECLDVDANNRLFGTEPVFIFDPDDDSNRPVAGEQDNPLTFWPLYPQFVKDLFTQSFTDGLDDPRNGRVQESQWRRAMMRLHDSVYVCRACGAENFYDAAATEAARCWRCTTTFADPARLLIGAKANADLVILNEGTRLYPHHTARQRYDRAHPTAEVVRHPTAAGVFGLRNDGTRPWSVTPPDGSIWTVEPGRSAALAVGSSIDFGSVRAKLLGSQVGGALSR